MLQTLCPHWAGCFPVTPRPHGWPMLPNLRLKKKKITHFVGMFTEPCKKIHLFLYLISRPVYLPKVSDFLGCFSIFFFWLCFPAISVERFEKSSFCLFISLIFKRCFKHCCTCRDFSSAWLHSDLSLWVNLFNFWWMYWFVFSSSSALSLAYRYISNQLSDTHRNTSPGRRKGKGFQGRHIHLLLSPLSYSVSPDAEASGLMVDTARLTLMEPKHRMGKAEGSNRERAKNRSVSQKDSTQLN